VSAISLTLSGLRSSHVTRRYQALPGVTRRLCHRRSFVSVSLEIVNANILHDEVDRFDFPSTTRTAPAAERGFVLSHQVARS